MILRFVVLQQSPLHLFLFSLPGNVDRTHRTRIQAGVIHTRRQRTRGGVEVLDLLGFKRMIPLVFGQGNCSLEVGTGMTRDEIGNQELFFSRLFVVFDELSPEPIKHLSPWLPHGVEDPRIDVFRGDFELSADVVRHKLFEKCFVVIRYQVVEPYSRADEYLFYTRKLSDSS